MVFFIKSRRFLMIGTWVCFVAGALVFVLPQHAFAGRSPDCGRVDDGVVRDVYVAALRVAYLVDVQDTVDTFCKSAEGLRQWEKEHPRERRNREYKNARDTIIKSVETDMRALRGRLIVFRGLLSCDPHNKMDLALRKAKLKKARKQISSREKRLSLYPDQIDLLMQDHVEVKAE